MASHDHWDRQRDIDAEGQRAAVYYAEKDREQVPCQKVECGQRASVRTPVDDKGTAYMIRDIWSYGYGEYGSRLVTCQYAVKQPDGRVAWFDCPEGVRFADIEPYEAAA